MSGKARRAATSALFVCRCEGVLVILVVVVRWGLVGGCVGVGFATHGNRKAAWYRCRYMYIQTNKSPHQSKKNQQLHTTHLVAPQEHEPQRERGAGGGDVRVDVVPLVDAGAPSFWGGGLRVYI